jgi:hypothetical protein
MTNFKSTIPGYKNQNGQEVISKTGLASESFTGQTIYHSLRTMWLLLWLRRCPDHDGGAKGERLIVGRGPESFFLLKRLIFVVFCDSLGTCAFECPDL